MHKQNTKILNIIADLKLLDEKKLETLKKASDNEFVLDICTQNNWLTSEEIDKINNIAASEMNAKLMDITGVKFVNELPDPKSVVTQTQSQPDNEILSNNIELEVFKYRPIMQFKKYEIINEIDSGGMGKIFKAVDKDLQRTIAIKVALPKVQNIPRSYVRFIEEAQITGQLEHPNIVPVHELGITNEGSIYFAMKYIKGVSLLEILSELADFEKKQKFASYKSTIDLESASVGENYKQSDEQVKRKLLIKNYAKKAQNLTWILDVFLKICDAVAYSHSKGVIHRDLKPENIMIGDYGEVVLMDWGLAKLLDKHDAESSNHLTVKSIRYNIDSMKTTDGAVAGTPAYMSPEQAQGKTTELDKRSDIYSLGTILYELLTLKRPFKADSVSQLLTKIINGNFKTPKLKNPERNIPAELEAICQKAMQKKPEHRYWSVMQISNDIRTFLEGGFLKTVEYTKLSLIKKIFKQNKIAAWIIVTLILGLFLGISISSKIISDNSLRENNKKAQFLISQARSLLSKGNYQQARDKCVQAIIISPSNSDANILLKRIQRYKQQQDQKSKSTELLNFEIHKLEKLINEENLRLKTFDDSELNPAYLTTVFNLIANIEKLVKTKTDSFEVKAQAKDLSLKLMDHAIRSQNWALARFAAQKSQIFAFPELILDNLVKKIDVAQFSNENEIKKQLEILFRPRKNKKWTDAEILEMKFKLIGYPDNLVVPMIFSKIDSFNPEMHEIAIFVLGKIINKNSNITPFLLQKLRDQAADIQYRIQYFNAISYTNNLELAAKLLKIRWEIGNISQFFKLTIPATQRLFGEILSLDPELETTPNKFKSMIYTEKSLTELFKSETAIDKALKYINLAIKHDNSEPLLQSYKAYILLATRQYSQAIELFTSVLQKHKENLFALRYRAAAYSFQNQNSQADKDWQLIEILYPRDLISSIIKADIELKKGYPETALKTIEKAMEYSAGTLELTEIAGKAYLQLSKKLIKDGKKADIYIRTALKNFQLILKTKPNSIEILLTTADALILQGEFEKAEEFWKKVYDINSLEPKLYLHKGIFFLNKALKTYNNQTEKKILLNQAKKAFEISLEFDGFDPSWQTFYYLGYTLYYLNYKKMAVKNWQLAHKFTNDESIKLEITELVNSIE